jgi:SWIM zinc finger
MVPQRPLTPRDPDNLVRRLPMQSVTQKGSRDTRELRALELYRKHGEEIRHAGEDLYLVPSCTGSEVYTVDYAVEVCDCPDFQYHGENCKHILAVGIYAAKRRLRVSAAGDPFVAAGFASKASCTCTAGSAFLGRVVESEHDLDGEVVEYERVPCRRCNA